MPPYEDSDNPTAHTQTARDEAWNPARYDQFQTERAQPFYDLLALVEPHPSMRVIDLGCGGGALTHELHQRLRAAETVGIDSAARMLADSAQHAAPGLSFLRQDIDDFHPKAAYDLIFSNAALHWMEDHPRLFHRLRDALHPEGQLAIQLPANQDYATHLAAEQTAREQPFEGALRGTTHPRAVLTPTAYALLLHQLEFTHQTVRMEVYGHLLDSRESVVDWVRGSLLTWYEGRLSPDLFARFVERYREILFSMVPHEYPFFLPYQRILIHGVLG